MQQCVFILHTVQVNRSNKVVRKNRVNQKTNIIIKICLTGVTIDVLCMFDRSTSYSMSDMDVQVQTLHWKPARILGPQKFIRHVLAPCAVNPENSIQSSLHLSELSFTQTHATNRSIRSVMSGG